MSSVIKIDLKSVISENKDIESQYKKAKKIKAEVQSIRSNVDSKILSRRNISGHFSNANSQLQEVESDLKKLNQFITSSMDRYEQAEKNVEKLTDTFQDKHPILGFLEQAWKMGEKVFSVPFALLTKAKDLAEQYKTIVSFIKSAGSIVANFDYNELKKNAIEKMKNFVDGLPAYLKNGVSKFADAIARSPQYIYLQSKIDSVGKFTNKLMDKINTKFIQPIKNIDFSKWVGEKRLAAMKQMLKEANAKFTKFSAAAKEKITKVVKNKHVVKFFKTVSGIGDAMSILESGKKHFKDGNKWTFGPSNFFNFASDIVLDGTLPKLAARVALAATGPVGIGVSMVAVGATTFALEFEYGNPPKSALDRTKEFANKQITTVTKRAEDWIGEKVDTKHKKSVNAATALRTEVCLVGAGNLSKALRY